MQYVLYYFIAVSVIGAIVCIYDKLAAARGWRRVPERTLFFWALIGGGPGVYATMLIIRHKTLHHIFHARHTGNYDFCREQLLLVFITFCI